MANWNQYMFLLLMIIFCGILGYAFYGDLVLEDEETFPVEDTSFAELASQGTNRGDDLFTVESYAYTMVGCAVLSIPVWLFVTVA